MAWFFDALMLRSLPGLAEGPCLEAASAEAAPPDDAELEVATFEEQGDASVFIARWRHVVEGVPVERDYIQVLVNPRTGKPFALHRRWHTVDRRAIVR